MQTSAPWVSVIFPRSNRKNQSGYWLAFKSLKAALSSYNTTIQISYEMAKVVYRPSAKLFRENPWFVQIPCLMHQYVHHASIVDLQHLFGQRLLEYVVHSTSPAFTDATLWIQDHWPTSFESLMSHKARIFFSAQIKFKWLSHVFHTQLQWSKRGKVNSKTLQENWKTTSTRPVKDYNLLADETLSLGKDTKLGWTGYIQTTRNTYRRNFGVTEVGTSQHHFLFICQELRAWHLLQIAQATISMVYLHQSHNLEPRKLSIYQQSITSDPSMSNH